MHFLSSSLVLCIALSLSARAEEDGKKESHGCIVGAVSQRPVQMLGESGVFQHNERDVRLYLPKIFAATTPHPLIIALRDVNQTTAELEAATGLGDSEKNNEYVVVYPDHDYGKTGPGADIEKKELEFVSDVLDNVLDRLCIDTDRIYVTGLGTGGGLANLVACDKVLSTKVAAFGIVNGALYHPLVSESWETCEPGRRPVPIVNIQSVKNEVYDYWGEEEKHGKRSATVKWLIEWAVRNGCGKSTGQPAVIKDGSHVAELSRGTLNEGVIHNGAVGKAEYKCWLGETKRASEFDEDVQVLSKDGENMTEEAKASTEQDAESKEKIEGLEKSAKVSLVHYAMHGFGHGWPKEGDSLINSNETNQLDTTRVLRRFFRANILPTKAQMESSLIGKDDEDEPILDTTVGDDVMHDIKERIESEEGWNKPIETPEVNLEEGLDLNKLVKSLEEKVEDKMAEKTDGVQDPVKRESLASEAEQEAAKETDKVLESVEQQLQEAMIDNVVEKGIDTEQKLEEETEVHEVEKQVHEAMDEAMLAKEDSEKSKLAEEKAELEEKLAKVGKINTHNRNKDEL